MYIYMIYVYIYIHIINQIRNPVNLPRVLVFRARCPGTLTPWAMVWRLSCCSAGRSRSSPHLKKVTPGELKIVQSPKIMSTLD